MAAALKNFEQEQLQELANEAGKVMLSCQYCNNTCEIDIHSVEN
jgi:redox-regulated HSP33 family molecular chaperone